MATTADDLVKAIIGEVSGVLQTDFTLLQGFSRSQLQKIGEQGVWLLEAEAMGMFTDNPALRDHFVKGIEELMRNFMLTLQGLAIITAEKVWNAMVKVVWSALDKAVGFALPRPVF
jgi:hypothetical protein